MTQRELVEAINRKLREETQRDEAQLRAYLRRHGEDEQSIQRHMPKVPRPWKGPGPWRG